MQLWKKNFLVTFMMFLFIIYGSLLLLHGLLYRNELEQWMARAVSGEKGRLGSLGTDVHADKERIPHGCFPLIPSPSRF